MKTTFKTLKNLEARILMFDDLTARRDQYNLAPDPAAQIVQLEPRLALARLRGEWADYAAKHPAQAARIEAEHELKSLRRLLPAPSPDPVAPKSDPVALRAEADALRAEAAAILFPRRRLAMLKRADRAADRAATAERAHVRYRALLAEHKDRAATRTMLAPRIAELEATLQALPISRTNTRRRSHAARQPDAGTIYAMFAYDGDAGTLAREATGFVLSPATQAVMIGGVWVQMHRIIGIMAGFTLRPGERLRSMRPDWPDRWARRYLYVHSQARADALGNARCYAVAAGRSPDDLRPEDFNP